MKTSCIKPGLLVSLKTSIRGGVNYRRVDIEPDHVVDGARVAKWETEREIPDPVEYEAATVARGKARAAVAGACCVSSFGLLCPSANESDLSGAIEDARLIANLHNATARLTQVEVFVLVGRVASDDVEAARAIAAEVRELLDQMARGIAAADPEVIREAANKARNLGGMLSAEVAGRVSDAIAEARKAAREIVRRVEKSGEVAAVVVAECSVSRIEAARFAFLDLDEGEAGDADPMPARGLDLAPVGEPGTSVPEMFALQFDGE